MAEIIFERGSTISFVSILYLDNSKFLDGDISDYTIILREESEYDLIKIFTKDNILLCDIKYNNKFDFNFYFDEFYVQFAVHSSLSKIVREERAKNNADEWRIFYTPILIPVIRCIIE